MSIVVVGNVDPVKISKVIENGVKKNEPFEEKIKKVYPTEPDEVAKQYAEQSLSVAMPLFMTGFKDTNNGFGGDELFLPYLLSSQTPYLADLLFLYFVLILFYYILASILSLLISSSTFIPPHFGIISSPSDATNASFEYNQICCGSI